MITIKIELDQQSIELSISEVKKLFDELCELLDVTNIDQDQDQDQDLTQYQDVNTINMVFSSTGPREKLTNDLLIPDYIQKIRYGNAS